MARGNDDSWILWAIGALILYEEMRPSLERASDALKQGGAKAYEVLHPSEREHMNDLPGHLLTKAAVFDLAVRTGFADPRVATAIAMAESGGVPNGLGDLRDGQFISIGLWQINIRAHPEYTREQMMDPGQNALAALKISKGGTDWRPWSTWWKDAKRKIGPGEGRFKAFL
jgi:hypothetical protein